MRWIDKMERKIGRFAVRRLIIYILAAYAVGYALQFFSSLSGNNIYDMLVMNPEAIFHGEVWRIFTWILSVPADYSDGGLLSLNGVLSLVFMLFMFYFYYWIGSTLEAVWGTFRYNLFMFTGILFMTVTPLLLYLISGVFTGFRAPVSVSATTYYLNLTSFLAYAVMFPDNKVYVMMILPVKMKWLALVDIIFLGITMIRYTFYAVLYYTNGYTVYGNIMLGEVIMIVVSVLNFILFFFLYRRMKFGSKKQRQQQRNFKRKVKTTGNMHKTVDPRRNSSNESSSSGQASGSRHYCAVCGRTELTNPELQFRFCSKCVGNLEYCSDHLFSHAHRKI